MFDRRGALTPRSRRRGLDIVVLADENGDKTLEDPVFAATFDSQGSFRSLRHKMVARRRVELVCVCACAAEQQKARTAHAL